MTERESIRLNNVYLKAIKAIERLDEVAIAISNRENKQRGQTLASRMQDATFNALSALKEV